MNTSISVDALVMQLTGHVPQRGRKKKDLGPDFFTTGEARTFLKRFAWFLNSMEAGQSVHVTDLGTFRKKTRVAREIVGFDGETTYKTPETVVLTFRETRPMKKKPKAKKSRGFVMDDSHWGRR